ncbi:MAG: methylamine utilization protein [Pseudomonadota bacterium]
MTLRLNLFGSLLFTFSSLCLAGAAPDTRAVSELGSPRTVIFELRAGNGERLPDAAVVVTGEHTEPHPSTQGTAIMSQVNERFEPDFVVVEAGASVAFPNNDRVMHHVYSFSQARQFEIPLYQDEQPSPIRFDRSGVVIVGCNIHDQMIGTIVVTDTPYFAMTDARGRAAVPVPAGATTVDLWYRKGERYVRTERAIPSKALASTRGRRVTFTIDDATSSASTTADSALEWNEDY